MNLILLLTHARRNKTNEPRREYLVSWTSLVHDYEMHARCIREHRKERSLTLKQLANRTGLSVSLISQIELGKSAASMSTLHKLATALQVKMTFFFETV